MAALRRLALVLAGFFIVLPTSASAMASELLDVRFGVTAPDKTRIVLDVNGPVDYALSGDRREKGRLILDVGDLKVKTAGQKTQLGGGLIASYRYAAQPDGAARFVFDFGETAKIADAFVLSPQGRVKKHRLVIDLARSNEDEFIASLPKRYKDITAVIQATTQAETIDLEPVAPMPVEPEKKARKKEDWPIIVIDAGHGGADPGAKGQSGTEEKDVTLLAALKLAEILKAKGRYRIILTRASDERIGAKDRAELARNAKPQLFISLHADAIGDKDLRGGSVYTLSQEGKERSFQEAMNEGDFLAPDLLEDKEKEVGSLLHKLAQRTTLDESALFAELLVKSLDGVTPLLNNTLRQKDLRVLLAPDVPAVLLELAFISNKKDEANLNSPIWREKTIKAVASAIDEYFEQQEKSHSTAVADPRQAG